MELCARVDGPGPELADLVDLPTRSDARPTVPRRAPLGGSAVPTWNRAELAAGAILAGPALIQEFTSVVLVPKAWVARVERSGLVLSSPQRRSGARNPDGRAPSGLSANRQNKSSQP